MIRRVIDRLKVVPMEVWVFLACVGLTAAWMLVSDPEDIRLDRIIWTLVLAASVAGIKRFPLPGFLAFVLLFCITFLIPDLFVAPFVFFCAMAIVMVSYAGRMTLIVPAGLVVTVLGLVDRKDLVVETSLPVVFPWLILIVIAASAGWALGKKTREKAELSAQWQREYAERREELARTLHDSVAASLTSIVMRSEVLALSYEGQGKLEKELSDIAADGRTTMSQVRSLLTLLNAPEENPKGPKAPTLQQSITKAAEKLRRNGFAVDVSDEVNAVALTHPTLEILARVLAESSVNAIKYAEPGSKVSIRATGDGDCVTVQIRNRIASKDYRSRPSASVLTSGMGVEMMRKSISSLGGKLKTANDGEFWTVTAEMAPKGTT